MNSDVDELARAILKKPLQECSLEELQEIAEEHPYFAPIQLLLAKKIGASTFTHNDNATQYDEQVQRASLYFQNRVWMDHLLNHNEPLSGPTLTAGEKTLTTGSPETSQPFTSDLNQPGSSFVSGSEHKNEEAAVKRHEEVSERGNAGSIDESGQQQSLLEKTTAMQHAAEQSNEAKNDPVTVPVDNTMLFEPFHTVDYFASQGIKFREEEKPKDRLGIQLKSFTEWLKTLKQVTVQEIVSQVDSRAEKKVEQMAEFSLAERHVITEAMAEVWKKQGNKAKAEEIYRKLSLLDPSKSSYFAAKIEELKKTN